MLAPGLGYIVENHSKRSATSLLHSESRLPQILRTRAPGTRNENDSSGISRQDHPIGEAQDGRGINDHKVIRCQSSQQIAHHGSAQQFRGIRGRIACRQELQARYGAFDQGVLKASRARQNVCEPRPLLESDRARRAQIAFNQGNPMAGQGQYSRQAGSRHRGPLLRTSRGDDQDSPVALRQRVEHVGAGGTQLLLHLDLRPSAQPP